MTRKVERRPVPDVERIVFFGTPEFAVPSLEALCDAGRAPSLVVSQPSRPAGRKGRRVAPPVAAAARARGLDLEQPERISRPGFHRRLRRLEPDLAIVVAFGQIFPRGLLELPALGCVNLHASLLPRHRGAAPIQAAIAAGDDRSGVTTMMMDEGLDTGPLLLRREVDLEPDVTGGSLARQLARLGAGLVVETIEALAASSLEPVPQDEGRATYAPRLRREDGRLDWSESAERLERRVRAYDPWPGTFVTLAGEPVKVLAARRGPPPERATPGEILRAEEGALVIACGDGSSLAVDRWQRPGRRAVSGSELANGLRLGVGDRLG